ncbi:MAG TPA: patatin-like phospholipase family protein [Burkholderiales bacterium]|nr:patatin-like phospholipase family protein [Burkholderiales bacterium]
MDTAAAPKPALVLTGGGARAAYQVGVLRALAEFLPPHVRAPFSIIGGTSAGAVNAAVLAEHGSDFREGVRRLLAYWRQFHAGQVYRADAAGVFRNSGRWCLAALSGGGHRDRPMSLLDNTPLRELLSQRVDFSKIQQAIDAGDLLALTVTASGYASGESVTFFQGAPHLTGWRRARRVGVPMNIGVDHVMASSALPFIFPPVHIHREYFGDGTMRQVAPVSPALHLGAERVLVIGVGHQNERRERLKAGDYPSLAQIAGHALNSIFLDSLEMDLERMQRINRLLDLVPPGRLVAAGLDMRSVAFRVLTPSEELERIASQHVGALPRSVRMLLHTVGALHSSGSNLASYLLFERPFCRALINLGYHDTLQRKDDLLEFLGYDNVGVRSA